MADLHRLLQGAAPLPPEFDEGALLRTIARRNRRRRIALSAAGLAIVTAAGLGIVSMRDSDRHAIVVTPSSTTTPHVSVPSSTATSSSTTTTSTSTPRPIIEPIQTSAMPSEAFVAVGPALVAIDTHDPTQRRTLTTFPADSSIDWITADVPHGRVFFGVTSGCDPGINGMYEMPAAGGTQRKIAPDGNRAAVSPDGTKIAYSLHTDGCGSTDLVIQDVASGSRKTFSGNRSIDVGGWSADGQSVFLWAYDGSAPTVFRFRPFADGAQLDKSQRWDTGIAADAGGGRIAILHWCTSDIPDGCVPGVRTRSETASGPDFSFGAVTSAETLSIDSSGQWPLVVKDNPSGQVVSFYAGLGTWQVLAPGNAADW